MVWVGHLLLAVLTDFSARLAGDGLTMERGFLAVYVFAPEVVAKSHLKMGYIVHGRGYTIYFTNGVYISMAT